MTRKSSKRIKLDKVCNDLPEPMLIYDSVGRVVAVNKEVVKITGFNKIELEGKKIEELPILLKEDLLSIFKKMKAKIKGKIFSPYNLRLKTKKGNILIINIKGRKIDYQKKPFVLLSFRDITEQIKLEKNLRKEKEKSKKYIDVVGEMIVVLNPKGNVELINKIGVELLGYEKNEIIGKNWFENFLEEREIEVVKKVFQAIMAGKLKPVEKFENFIINKKGERRLISWRNTYIKDEKNGKIIGSLGSGRDITKQREIEKSNLRFQKRFEDIARSSGDWIWEVDSKGRYTYASGKVKQILGYESKEIVGKTPFDFMPKYERDRVGILFSKISKGKKRIIDLENWNLTKEGEKVCLLTNGVPVLGLKGELLGYRGVDKDITYRKISEEKIKASERKFREVFENARDAIFWTNPKTGIILNCNRTAEKLLEKDRKDIVGFSQKTLHPLKKAKLYEERFKKHIKAEGLFDDEAEIVTSKGEVKPVSISSSIISFNHTVMLQSTFIDLSEKKRIEKAKTEFVSLASHQLLTPLTASKWHAEALLKVNGLNQRQKTSLREIYISNKRMIGLIRALLNVSRIEMGSFKVSPKLINILDIAEMSIGELAGEIKNKNLKLTKRYDKKLSKIYLDPNLVKIIFQNLLSNAVKYTRPKGSIELIIKKDGNDIFIQVSDTGCGIPQHQKKEIFTKLFRADNARELDTAGTGLGLYIIKSILKENNGKIWFDSKVNKGSKFYVTLPISGMKKREGIKELA